MNDEHRHIKAMCFAAQTYLDGLAVFTGIKKTPLMETFRKLIDTVLDPAAEPADYLRTWAAFIAVFVRDSMGRTFFMMLTDIVLADENIFTQSAERGEFDEKSLLAAAVRHDMSALSRIGDFNLPLLLSHIAGALENTNMKYDTSITMAAMFEEMVQSLEELQEKKRALSITTMPYGLLSMRDIKKIAAYIRKNGAGLLRDHCFFSWEPGKGLIPAQNPDTVTLEDLSGYEAERSIALENTARFVKGKAASNILLYGDRGTGKSAAVKAICRRFKNQRLRLVEVRKQDLSEIPRILPVLSQRGMRFILFIDDLSFETQNDEFTLLKGLLEGGIEARPDNVAVYATSNRRHLIKETVSGAAGGGREFDTVQEQLSLSDRFGITIIFATPSQNDYLSIVEFLAVKRGLFSTKEQEPAGYKALEKARFFENAKKWERWFNGRSPRTARQFVEWTVGGGSYPWE